MTNEGTVFRKAPILFVLVVLLAGLVTGCEPTPQATTAVQRTQPLAPTSEPTEVVQPTAEPPSVPAADANRLILATTTSTADSGLLDAILPDFEQANNASVEVIAVGTGQALEIGSSGDADVVLVHSRAGEDKFVAEGHAKERFDVMYNDFVVVGPTEDPAGIAGMETAQEAFTAIAQVEAPFASRGDESGTHIKELDIWKSAGITPTQETGWYRSIGQGMGDTLLFASELQAYTLADRGTYLSMRDKLPGLRILVGGENLAENRDKKLLNPYGILAVDPEKHPGVNYALAIKFIEWLLSPETQTKIGSYGVEVFGQPLFYPNQHDD